MTLFDSATWAAIGILVIGSAAIFVWFLKDAGRVLRGEGQTAAGQAEPGQGHGGDAPAGHAEEGGGGGPRPGMDPGRGARHRR